MTSQQFFTSGEAIQPPSPTPTTRTITNATKITNHNDPLTTKSTPITYAPPVPPVRSSSLRTAAPEAYLPSLQVIQATPTKSRGRRKKNGSVSSGSPTRSSHNISDNALLVHVEPQPGTDGSRMKSEIQEIDIDMATEEEIKKARSREMNKLRQRRKRQKDKDALQAASANHLSIPSRSRSNTIASHSSLELSVPSSTSTTYSSLPVSASISSLSPNQSYCTSMSGTSSPSAMFSPAISNPESFDWRNDGISGLDLGGGPVERSLSGFETGSTFSSVDASRRPSMDAESGLPPCIPKRHGPFSAKRRKSEPESDLSLDTHHVGLGVAVSQSMSAIHPRNNTRRPQPRRFASEPDGTLLTEWGRSPTPPPVPNLPEEYRQVDSTITSSPVSSKGNFFASTILMALRKEACATLVETLEIELGVGVMDLEAMSGDIGLIYDNWSRKKDVSVVEASKSSQNANLPSGPILSPSKSPERLPPINEFVTPARPHSRRAVPPTLPLASQSGIPMYPTTSFQTHESPLALNVQSPAHTQPMPHSRQRSVSSASLIARGLSIVPQKHNQLQPRWVMPETPTQHDRIPSDSTSAESPTLHTPSSASGQFHFSVQAQAAGREEPDMGFGRSASYQNFPQWDNKGLYDVPPSSQTLESPLMMVRRRDQVGVVPHASQSHHTASTPSRGRMPIHVPYTPPTPLPIRGVNPHGHSFPMGPSMSMGMGVNMSMDGFATGTPLDSSRSGMMDPSMVSQDQQLPLDNMYRIPIFYQPNFTQEPSDLSGQ